MLNLLGNVVDAIAYFGGLAFGIVILTVVVKLTSSFIKYVKSADEDEEDEVSESFWKKVFGE